MSESKAAISESRFDFYTVVILILVLVVPVLVLPYVLDNPFNMPKSLVMLMGVLLMVGVYVCQIYKGKAVLKSLESTNKILLLLIFLNLFSLIYTENYYYTVVAAILNISCLVFFYFVSMRIDGKRAFLFFIVATISGILVSIIVWLQYYNIYILIKWAKSGSMSMGTIGNSNYLGAYLIFPLYTCIGLIPLFKGKVRLVPVVLSLFVMVAFLFSRARASWMGFFLSLPIFLIILNIIYRETIQNYIQNHKGKVIKYSVLSIAILIALWFIAPQRFHDMMDFKKVTESRTLLLRVNKYFRPSIWLFSQSPLFGTGLWSYRNMVYKAQAEIERTIPGFFDDYPDPKPRRAHNDYLEILNDGGLVAATVLLLFLITVMKHGWIVIKDKAIPNRDRVLSATAFSAIIAVMLAALLFFPFRVNTTMFMTVLMMGILEGMYLRNQGLIAKIEKKGMGIGMISLFAIFLLLIGIAWYGVFKPFMGEREHFKYKMALRRSDIKSAEKHILKAIEYNPNNSMYHVVASQLYLNLKNIVKASDFAERAIIGFNGDLTLWSVWYLKGVIDYHKGSILESKAAFEKALYYYPLFDPAIEKLKIVNEIIEKRTK